MLILSRQRELGIDEWACGWLCSMLILSGLSESGIDEWTAGGWQMVVVTVLNSRRIN